MSVQIRRVLVSVQFGDALATTVAYACALAERFGAELHLLHILEETPEPDAATLTPKEGEYASGGEEGLLAGVVPPEWEQRLICRRAVAFGVPWVEITRYAWDHRVDAIVLSNSRRPSWWRWLWGSVVDQVIHHAPCIVVAIPYPERQFPLP